MCGQWNRGVGFLCAVDDPYMAGMLVAQAEWMGFEAAIAGKITGEPVIHWRGHEWNL